MDEKVCVIIESQEHLDKILLFNKHKGIYHSYASMKDTYPDEPVCKELIGNEYSKVAYYRQHEKKTTIITFQEFEQSYLVEKPSFIVGKWYKNIGTHGNYIAKFSKLLDDKRGYDFCSDGFYIYNNKYEKTSGSGDNRIATITGKEVECPLSEIEHLLPEGHPDKPLKCTFVKDKWYNILWKWYGKRYIAKFDRFEYGTYHFSEAFYEDKSKGRFGTLSFVEGEMGDFREATPKELEERLPSDHKDRIVEPMVLISGEVYVSIHKGNPTWNSIFTSGGGYSNRDRLYLDGSSFKSKESGIWAVGSHNIDFRKATEEEKDWLARCHKANTLVPREIIREKPMEYIYKIASSTKSDSKFLNKYIDLDNNCIVEGYINLRMNTFCPLKEKAQGLPGAIYTDPTKEEIGWLEACIKAGAMVERAAEKHPKIGEYYTVKDTSFEGFMIGIVHSIDNESCDTSRRGIATFLSCFKDDKEFDKDRQWCYKDIGRTFSPSTKEEREWLDRCIKADRFVPREEVIIKPKKEETMFKIGDKVKYGEHTNCTILGFDKNKTIANIDNIPHGHSGDIETYWFDDNGMKINYVLGSNRYYVSLHNLSIMTNTEDVQDLKHPANEKFSLGKVKFKGKKSGDKVSSWTTSIPHIKHGDVVLHADYDKLGADIIGLHNEFYEVRYKDVNGGFPVLGFKREQLENFSVLDSDNSDDKLLKEARKKFIPGTTFHSTGGNRNCLMVENCTFTWHDNEIRVDTPDGYPIGRVYKKNGGWAQILSIPDNVPQKPKNKNVNLITPKENLMIDRSVTRVASIRTNLVKPKKVVVF